MVFLGGWNIVDVTLNHILSCILAYCDRARWVKNQWYFDAGCSIFSIRYITYVLGVFYGRNMNVLEFIISTYKYIWTFARGGLEYPLKDLKYYRNASKLTQFVTNFEWKRRKQPCKKKNQQNHANLVRNYLSFNRLKHAMFYLSSFFLFQWNWYCVRSRCQDPYIQYIPVLHGILTEWS